MAPAADPSEQVLASTIASALQICTRLDRWTSRSTTSHVVGLVCRRMRELLATTRRLARELDATALRLAAEGDGADTMYHLPISTLDTLSLVKSLISEVLTLQEFCLEVELEGDDGATNAVYASLFISAETERNEDDFRHVAVKKCRVQKSAEEILNSLYPIGPNPATENRSADQSLPISAETVLNDRPSLYRFAESVRKQMSPMYLHEYRSITDAPYHIVTSSSPSQGGFGLVRQVVNKQTNEVFAQKTFQGVYSESKRKEILREIGVLELCQHRNIVTLIEAYSIAGDPSHDMHIVMSPWAPYTLLEFLCQPDAVRRSQCTWFEPNRQASETRIYLMMSEMVCGLEYLHDLSIKHKDIKPENILLYEDEHKDLIPLIADVGTSKVYRRVAHTNYYQGSYPYLAPEQIQKRESSLKADIWQLGCCFAMLLTVAQGGTKALNRLWNSFEYTAAGCSCNIARESEQFMATFKDICLPGNEMREFVFAIISRMLRLDPADRLDISQVKMEFGELLG